MISPNAQLIEQVLPITGLAPKTPSTTTPDYVSLKGYDRCCVLIQVANGSTVTGSAITLKQATAVAGTSEKALAFSKVYRNIDTLAASPLAEATVSSDTFTTDTTNSKNLLYVIEVKATDLDFNNGFDCIRAGTGDAANTTLAVLYLLYPLRYGRNPQIINPIID